MEEECKDVILSRHQWINNNKYTIPYNSKVSDMLCYKVTKPGCKKVLPTTSKDEVIIWDSCLHTLFAAMKRQVSETPLPHPEAIKEFHKYVDYIFDNEIQPLLYDFKYNAGDWFNHLTYKQQIELVGKENTKITQYQQLVDIMAPKCDEQPITYKLFPKREIQIIEGTTFDEDGNIIPKFPKTRAISAPDPSTKWIMGPVVWQLETIFANNFKGYCGGTNWAEQEQKLEHLYSQGYKYVAYGDGSAWDKTQSHELKYIDYKIYQYLIDQGNINHVDSKFFAAKTLNRYRNLIGSLEYGGKIIDVMKCVVDATVMSGNSDTTFGNTVRMSMVNRFILDQLNIDYELWCKGDDFVIFLKNDNINLEEVYYKYWVKGNKKKSYGNKEYGLGLVLKFLKTGPISDFDFCSTNVIQEGNKFKLVRLADRMNYLTHWSIKALSMSREQQNEYMNSIAQGIDSWAANMPYFSDYSKLIKYHYPINSTKNKNKKGIEKIQLIDHLKDNDAEMRELGRDEFYSHKLRISQVTLRDETVYQFLYNKYGLTITDIDRHFKQLMKNVHNDTIFYKDWDV